jgi:hypothetical protein
MNNRIQLSLSALLLSAQMLLAIPASAESPGLTSGELTPEELTSYAIFYSDYEPTFYTGFAPRAQDSRRLHLHVGRGNQLRVTQVLSDRVVATYVRDLQIRYRGYRELIDNEKVVLTQNSGFEDFEKQIRELDVEALVDAEQGLSSEQLRERNLELIKQLNPDRIFSIHIPESKLLDQWKSQLRPADRKSMKKQRQLELLNQMLPTRLWLTELDAEITAALKNLVGMALDVDDDKADNQGRFNDAYFQLLDQISGGIYTKSGGQLQFDEFTAIYPIGSLNQYTKYKGRQIPLYPTPGKWLLTTHQRSKTVDHIPTVSIYSYSPWIPYMHVGKKLHNSFHTLWWRMTPSTKFLPDELKQAGSKSREGGEHDFMWLLSRGPMSHGCTHINTGHILELRQLLPAETEDLYKVEFFLNKSHLFDVFDIDGDMQPEVMGVRYFVAFSLRNKRPDKLRAPIERKAFYDWLYGGELVYDDQGRAYFKQIRDAHFVGRRAVDGDEYKDILLYEAAYQPQKLQFYSMVNIPFARELRKLGVGQPLKERK